MQEKTVTKFYVFDRLRLLPKIATESALLVLAAVVVVLDFMLLRRSQNVRTFDLNRCPAGVAQFNTQLCPGISYSFGAVGHTAEPYQIVMQFDEFSQHFSVAGSGVSKNTGLDELLVRTRVETSFDGLAWTRFRDYEFHQNISFRAGQLATFTLAETVPVGAPFVRLSILQSETGSAVFLSSQLTVTSTSSDYGFAQLVFKSVLGMVAAVVCAAIVGCYLLGMCKGYRDAQSSPWQQRVLWLIGATPLFISPFYLLSMRYQSQTLASLQHVLKAAFLGIWEWHSMFQAAAQLKTSVTHVIVLSWVFGCATFLLVGAAELAGVAQVYLELDVEAAQAGLAVCAAFVLANQFAMRIVLLVKLYQRCQKRPIAMFVGWNGLLQELLLVGILVDDIYYLGSFRPGLKSFDVLVSFSGLVYAWWSWEGRRVYK